MTLKQILVGGIVASCVARRTDRNSPPVVAPFGAFAVPRLLNPFSGHLPPSPPPAFPCPRLVPLWRVRPRLRLTKRFQRGSVTCTCDIDGNPHLEMRVREPLLGGHVELDSGSARLVWCKLWLFPGLTDAATRLELRSSLDMRSGRSDSEVRLRLRGVRRDGANGLRLVHRVPMSSRVSLDAGASLTLPDELRLSTDGSSDLRALASTQVELLVDQLDLRVEV